MAYQIFDRVQDTTTTTGTGNITCTGSTPVPGYTDFNTRLNTADTFFYLVEAVDTNGVATGDYEIGLGTGVSRTPFVFARTAVINSSNGGIGGSLVNFVTGPKRVHLTAPAVLVGTLAGLFGKGTNQTAANYQGTGVAIPFDSRITDTAYNAGLTALHDSVTNNTRITIPSFCGDCYVRLFGQVGISNLTSGDTIDLWIRQGGSGDAAHNSLGAQSGFGSYHVQVQSGVFVASAGDYFELMLGIGADTSVDILAARTRFGIEIVQ